MTEKYPESILSYVIQNQHAYTYLNFKEINLIAIPAFYADLSLIKQSA